MVERLEGNGHLTLYLEMFETDDFSNKILSSDYPFQLELEDMVYLQVFSVHHLCNFVKYFLLNHNFAIIIFVEGQIYHQTQKERKKDC